MSTRTDNTIILSNDDATAKALVSVIRSTVNGAGKYAAYVEAHEVTRETVKHHARALATLTYPSDEPVQARDGQRTRYGNAVQAAGAGLRGALSPNETDETKDTDWLALVRTAVENAAKHEVTADTITATVQDALGLVEQAG
jgi:hypothetical protein